MIVVDASVLVPALGEDDDAGRQARSAIAHGDLIAPQIIDLEVVSAWRGLTRAGRLEPRRAAVALSALGSLPLERVPHRPLLPRIWRLRDNLSAYDAAYVALAAIIEAPLVTADRRLASAAAPHCAVELVD